MTSTSSQLAIRPIHYNGEGWNIGRLQDEVGRIRADQNTVLGELEKLRARSGTVAAELGQEMEKLSALSRELVHTRRRPHHESLRSRLARVFGRAPLTGSSIERLLKEQYTVASVRVRESADAADRLKEIENTLRRDLEGINERIHTAAENREKALAYVQELERMLNEREAEQQRCTTTNGAEYRSITASLDRLRGLVAEHRTQAMLFGSAEERLDRLRESTSALAHLVSDLYADIARYVGAASLELDRVGSQIQAIGAAADAAVVLLEMKRSVELLGTSVRETSRFISETQVYLRSHIDKLVDDLHIFDEQTVRLLEQNRRESHALADLSRELEQ